MPDPCVPTDNMPDSLRASPDSSQVYRAELSQALVTAVQVSLVDLLASWDIRPSVTVGHSSGKRYSRDSSQSRSSLLSDVPEMAKTLGCCLYLMSILSSSVAVDTDLGPFETLRLQIGIFLSWRFLLLVNSRY